MEPGRLISIKALKTAGDIICQPAVKKQKLSGINLLNGSGKQADVIVRAIRNEERIRAMRPNDASHFSACAAQEARQAREARLRGADQATIALHNERAVRYQAMALRLQRQRGETLN